MLAVQEQPTPPVKDEEAGNTVTETAVVEPKEEEDGNTETAVAEPKVSSGEYLTKILSHVQKNAGAMRDEARKTQNAGSATAIGVFHKYITGMGRDREEHDELPKARSGPTKQGGKWYSNSVSVMLDNMLASPSVKRLGPNSFAIDAEIYVKPSDYPKVEALLQDTGTETTSPYWDTDTGAVAKRVDFPVFVGGLYEGTVFVFDETKMASLSATDMDTHLPRVRDTAKVRMENVKAKVNLVPYLQKNKKDKNDEGHWVLREYFSFTCSAMEATNDPVSSWPVHYEETMDQTAPVCVDIRDVLNGKANMSSTFYVNTAAGGAYEHRVYETDDEGNVIGDGKVVLARITLPAGPNDFTYNEKTRYFCTMVEVVPEKNQTCELTLSGWEDTAAQFGLDMTPDKESTKDNHSSTWDSIMKAHTLTAHFMCEYDEKRSMALPKNNSELVAEREKNDTYTNGSYAAHIKHCAVDWRDTLVKRGIPITKEKLLGLFSEVNKGKPSSEKTFKKVTEDGKDVYHFKSVLPGRNPVCNNGDYSEVIPLGSGERPTHQTEDAGVFLDKEGATFYALTSMPKELASAYGTPEEGNTEFDRQKAELGSRFKYVTFVVQKQNVLEKIRK